MRSLRHPHIVELHFSFQDESHVYLGMEFAEGGGMFDLLSKHLGPYSTLCRESLRLYLCN